MMGKNLIDVILENKDRIVYDGWCSDDYSMHEVFKLYLDTRNIFGFRKYILINCYDHLDRYDPLKDKPLDLQIEIPSWNFFKCREFINVDNNIELSKVLKDIYYRYQYNEDFRISQKIGKILFDDIRRK